MTKEELSDFILETLKKCYKVKHEDYPSIIFWIYDEQFIRKIKLGKINNQDIKITNEINGTCIFQQDFKKLKFRCNDDIWTFLFRYYSDDYYDNQKFMKDILKNITNLNMYLPTMNSSTANISLKNYKKISLYLNDV